MLTWTTLLAFYAGNVVFWLGIALAYVYFFHESDESILEHARARTEADE